MRTLKTKRLHLEKQRLADRHCRVRVGKAPPEQTWTATDFPVERLVHHLETNPIGRLLKLIAALPDVRYEKIEQAKKQISLSDEALDARLDMALDRVFEELTTEG